MDDELVEKVADAMRVSLDGFDAPVILRVSKPQAEHMAQAAIAAVLEHLSAVTPEMVEAGVTAWAVPRDSLQETLAAAYLAMLAKARPNA